MVAPRIYQSPDGTSLAIERPDGEFSLVEIGAEFGGWLSFSLLEVVPDAWARLVPDSEELR